MTSVAGRVKLRRSVTARSDYVWASNADVDVYTHLTRPVVVTMQPEVDHLVECGLVEKALDRSAQANGLTSDGLSGFAAQHCRDTLVSILNADSNLNVTTRRVNQKKKGPFISAQNRLGGSRFRQVSIEQHARTGAARELVEDGTWARIERAVVQSGERIDEAIAQFSEDESMHRDGRKLLEGAGDELARVLSLLEVGS
jgi:hypothetical protein